MSKCCETKLKYELTIGNKIASGGYGSVYKCSENTPGKRNLVIKIGLKEKSKLKFEAEVLNYLQGGIGIPKLRNYFAIGCKEYLLMEELGQNLEDFYKNQKRISIKDLMNKSIQMLNRIEFLHSKGLIHCDIKPQNFVMGKGKNENTVYLIDYGLSQVYIDMKTKKHIKFSDKCKTKGTIPYCSANSHLKFSLSRRDDLESLAYTIISLWKGCLPWETKKQNANKFEIAKKSKITMPLYQICNGTHMNMVYFLKHVKKLEFKEKPNYGFLKRLLQEISNQVN